MALIKGINSYSTVEEADAYFVDRLDVAAWEEASADLKAKALVTASAHLDNLTWTGIAADKDQPMAFPRIGSWFNSRSGYYETLSGIPSRVVLATCEMAHHLLNNEGLFDDMGRVINLSIQGIDLEQVIPPSKYPTVVKRLIKPLLRNSNERAWWRAN